MIRPRLGSRRLRSAAALLAAAVVLALSLPSAQVLAAASATARSGGASQQSALDSFGDCLSSGQPGDLLLVFDTSGSLSEGADASDPDDERIAAAKFLMQGLAEYAQADRLSLDVGVAGFADSFAAPRAWTSITDGQSEIDSEIDSFADQDTGFETDYWAAVHGARDALAARAAGQSRCQAWVWFSDGKYDLDYRSDDAERAAYGTTKPYDPSVPLDDDAAADQVQRDGQQLLCDPHGVVDSMRNLGIVTLAVGLGSDGSAFDTMRAIATGQSGSTSCGRPLAADQPTPGLFLRADQIDDLYLAFDQLSDPSNEPIQEPVALCQDAQCRDRKRVVLNDAIERASLLAVTSSDDFDVVVTSPSGASRTLTHRQEVSGASLGSASLTASWPSDRVVDLSLRRSSGPDSGWDGEWDITFVDHSGQQGGLAQTDLRLTGDLVPDVEQPSGSGLVAGSADNTVTLQLTRAGSGQVVPASGLDGADVDLKAEVVASDGSSYPVGTASDLTAADLGKPTTVDLSNAPPGPATVQLSLVLRLSTSVTKANGSTHRLTTTLSARNRGVAVDISPPPDFPTLPTRIDFGTLDGTGDLTAQLALTGSGCAWVSGVDPDSLDLPQGVTAAPVTSTASSASTKVCGGGALPVTISVEQIGDGLVDGTLQVLTQDEAATADPVAVPVAFTMRIERPRNERVFVPVLVIVTLIGVALPIGLLYLVKWRTAVINGSSLTILEVWGAISSTTQFLSAVTPREQDGRVVSMTSSRRRLPITEGAEIQTRTGLGLTEPGFCEVVGRAAAGSRGSVSSRNGRARLPLALQDTWLVVLDAADPASGPVTVVFLLSPAGGQLASLLQDARQRSAEVVERLRAALGAAGPGPSSEGGGPGPEDGGWGGGPGGADPAPTTDGWDSWGQPVGAPTDGSGRRPAGSAPAPPSTTSGDDW